MTSLLGFCAPVVIHRSSFWSGIRRRARSPICATRLRCVASSINSDSEEFEKSPPKFVDPIPDYEEPHPYGNGGIVNVPIWDGYNFNDASTEHQQAKIAFDAYVATEPRATNRWAIVCNADGIQWRNNLFMLSQDGGGNFGYRLTDLGITEIPESAALRIYGADLDTRELWTVNIGADERWLVIEPARESDMRVLLAFEGHGDAERLVDLLRAENKLAQAQPTRLMDISKGCAVDGNIIGIVPESTLINASSLGA